MKIAVVLTFLLSSAGGFSQLLYPQYQDTSVSNRLEIDGIAEYAASAIHRDFLNTLAWGGEIDDDMKNRSFGKHKENGNRAGVNANAEIRYVHRFGKLFGDSLTWMIKAGYFAVGAANYQEDLFGLAFYGNSSYLGQTLDFDGTNFRFMQFQKIGFGLVSKKRWSSITLNYVNVQNYADAVFRKGSLAFNEDASQVDLGLNGTFRSTYGSSFSKGAGFCVDLDLRIPVGTNSDYANASVLQLSAQNIGVAFMKGLQRYDADSNWTYDGFTFDSFRDGNNPVGKDFDLLDSLGVSNDTVRKAVWLPGYIQAAKLVDINSAKKVQSFFGVRFYPVFRGVPLLFAGAYWKALPVLHASASLSYGNFSGFRGGVYLTLALKKLNLAVGTDDVAGLVSPNGYGESFVTRLIWKLN
jgi:hypothetical protein